VSAKVAARGSARGLPVLRQRGFGPGDEVYGDAFVQIQLLKVKE